MTVEITAKSGGAVFFKTETADGIRRWSVVHGADLSALPTNVRAEAETYLAGHALEPLPPPPPPTAGDVRAEASRRMQALTGARDALHLDIIIANASREAIRLLRVKSDRAWTPAEAARAAELEAADAAIEAIRATSNALESSPPADYASDEHWPDFGGGA